MATGARDAASIAALIAAVHAEPDSRDAKAVLADAWIACADPDANLRGELAALQLARAGRAGEPPIAVAQREHALLERGAEAWAGTLAEHFATADAGLAFRDGWCVGGVLLASRAAVLAAAAREPAWRQLRVLRAAWSPDRDDDVLALLADPIAARVDHVELATQAAAHALASGPPRPAIATLVAARADDPQADLAPDSALAYADALPNLATLALGATGYRVLAFARAAPVIERLARLVLIAPEPTRPLVEALAARAGALRELVVWPSVNRVPTDRRGWTIRLVRARAPGPFERVHGRHEALPARPAWRRSAELVGALASCPLGLAEVVLEAPRGAIVAQGERRVAAALAALAPAHIVTPWPALAPRDPHGVVLALRFAGDGLLASDRVEPVWTQLVDELGQDLDTFTVGARPTPRRLGGEPLAKLRGYADDARVETVTIASRTGRARLQLVRPRALAGAGIQTVGELEVCGDPGDALAPLVELFALGDFVGGEVELAGAPPRPRALRHPFAAYGPGPEAAWLMIFGGVLAANLPPPELAAFARAHAGARVIAPARAGVIAVALAAHPAEVTDELAARAIAELRAILDRRIRFDVRARAAALLADAAGALGLALAPPEPRYELEVAFARAPRPDGTEARLVVNVVEPFGAPRLRAELRWRDPATMTGDLALALADGWQDVPTAAHLDAALLAIADRLRALGPAWLAARA